MTPLVLWLVHISWTTTYIVLAACALVAYLSIKGRSITWLVRRGKSRLRGHRMASRPLYYRRRAQLLRSYDELPLELLRGGHQ